MAIFGDGPAGRVMFLLTSPDVVSACLIHRSICPPPASFTSLNRIAAPEASAFRAADKVIAVVPEPVPYAASSVSRFDEPVDEIDAPSRCLNAVIIKCLACATVDGSSGVWALVRIVPPGYSAALYLYPYRYVLKVSSDSMLEVKRSLSEPVTLRSP